MTSMQTLCAALLLTFVGGCGPNGQVGSECAGDDVCASGLACSTYFTGAGCSDEFGCNCDFSFDICTASCSEDSDCPYGMTCHLADACGGDSNLCGR